VVQNGSFVGVVAQSEWGAIQAARQLSVTWNTTSLLPDEAQLPDWLRQQPTSDQQPVNTGDVDTALANAGVVMEATYSQPYQSHVSIGPSCAVADVQPTQATVYSSTQGVYPLQGAIAQLIGMSADRVHVIHMEGSGCYGHNGFTGGDRNAPSNYTFANNRVRVHWLSNSPIRVSALRSLGAMANALANESFMDELAYAAGVDPVQFRLNHLNDPRAVAVVQAAANQIGWQPHTTPDGAGRGLGIAFARYENVEAYVATAADVSVDASGRITLNHVAVAHDCGLIINPDGLRNQIEGNVVQSASRAILEQVNFDNSKITSVDWLTYAILRFQDIPPIDITLINHPDQPAWGAGKITTMTTPPAIANAIFHATGQRLRSVPLNPAQGAAGNPTSGR
jgi:CO/xanthine dehydrogenase Mo-binding subunit